MKTISDLINEINKINHQSYPHLKKLKGIYSYGDFTLSIDHVQGDPFASPSLISAKVPLKFPKSSIDASEKKTCFEDFLLRIFYKNLEKYSFLAKGSGKSGLLSVTKPGPEVIKRTAIETDNNYITVRFNAGFPALGRKINGKELIKMLSEFIPLAIRNSLFPDACKLQELNKSLLLAADQAYLRTMLDKHGLVCFIANNSILPRKSGISKKPLEKSIPFISPKSCEYSFLLPGRGKVSGMGIKKGITLIVGGGYHGKSTLLNAMERGIFNHVLGDGRELVVSLPSSQKLRAEDGRIIKNTDISMFINNLPNDKDTTTFSTADASGSTSEAAGVVEAIEGKTKLLLIDEDTSATNFLLRDKLMQSIVSKEKEPITPFTLRARDLFNLSDLSTVLVAGSSGAFFFIADTIIQMDNYIPIDITNIVKEKIKDLNTSFFTDKNLRLPSTRRYISPLKESKNRKEGKIRTNNLEGFSIGRASCDLRYVSQIADEGEVMALAFLTKYALSNLAKEMTVIEMAEFIDKKLSEEGFSYFTKSIPPNFTFPRMQNVLAALNRLRN